MHSGWQLHSSYVYTNLGQLWQGPMNGGSTQEQYLYCDSAHPHQLSNLSQSASTPTCSSKGTVDYTGGYDSWGNTTSQVRSGSTRMLSYDGQDHLVRWSSSVNNQEEWNIYDSSGERVLRRTYDGTNTVLTVFAFGEEEHAYSYSGSGSGDTNTSNTYYYTLAGRTLGTWDGTSPNAPTTNFLLTDTLGSVVSSFNNLPNGAAMVLGDQVYGPYGNQRVKQGTISTSKGFTGQFTDSVAGLDYYGARYYDPVIGQFLSADVVEGNGAGMDPYMYVRDNPETLVDPTGQYVTCVVVCGFTIGPKFPNIFITPKFVYPTLLIFPKIVYPTLLIFPKIVYPTLLIFPKIVYPTLLITPKPVPERGIATSDEEPKPEQEKPKEKPKRNPEADKAQKRADEIKNQMVKQNGWWFRKEVTVGVTIGNYQGGDELTNVTINETALGKWGEQVKSILEPDENFIMGEVGGPLHAEEVLVEHAKKSGFDIEGLGASNTFCGASSRNCAAMLLQELGSVRLGQDI